MRKLIILTTAILLSGYFATSQDLNQVLSDYLNVKNALVNSDSKTAAAAIITLQSSIQKEESLAQQKTLNNSIKKLVAAKENLDKQRIAFAQISPVLWKLVNNSKSITRKIYYQHCPMKNAYWMSTEEEIRNPYYGASMLTCGDVVERKN
ncbi:MAG: DUF3347 domain-containing protein [Bacteroidia bacterium]|nr:DUF3347 domain-containing protein [Bacteroidia bacterium]MCZ2277766.1 DUF3347 domain-containing protein [Bacteroidia bacterium]